MVSNGLGCNKKFTTTLKLENNVLFPSLKNTFSFTSELAFAMLKSSWLTNIYNHESVTFVIYVRWLTSTFLLIPRLYLQTYLATTDGVVKSLDSIFAENVLLFGTASFSLSDLERGAYCNCKLFVKCFSSLVSGT